MSDDAKTAESAAKKRYEIILPVGNEGSIREIKPTDARPEFEDHQEDNPEDHQDPLGNESQPGTKEYALSLLEKNLSQDDDQSENRQDAPSETAPTKQQDTCPIPKKLKQKQPAATTKPKEEVVVKVEQGETSMTERLLKKPRKKFKLMVDSGSESDEGKSKETDLTEMLEDEEYVPDDPDFSPGEEESWVSQREPKRRGRGRGRGRGLRRAVAKPVPARPTAYKKEWEEDRRLKAWVAPGKSGSNAWCRACLTHMKANKAELIAHSQSDRHVQRLKRLTAQEDSGASQESKGQSKSRRSKPRKVRVKFSDEEELESEEDEAERSTKRKAESDDEYQGKGKPGNKKKKKEDEKEEQQGNEEVESPPIMDYEAVMAIEETMMMQQEEHKAQMQLLERRMECEEEELLEQIRILKEQNQLLLMQKHNEEVNNAKLQMEINRLQGGLSTFSVLTYDAL